MKKYIKSSADSESYYEPIENGNPQQFEIYLRDLNPAARKRYIAVAGIEDPKGAVWDIAPIAYAEFSK